METVTLSNFILGIFATGALILLGILTYSVTKNTIIASLIETISNTPETIGEVKNSSKDTKEDIKEIKGDIRNVNASVDTKTESLRNEIQENRKESIDAHSQIGGNIETIRRKIVKTITDCKTKWQMVSKK